MPSLNFGSSSCMTSRNFAKVTRVGAGFELTLHKKKALHRDHLELSLLFRGWVCVHCNRYTLHKLDSLSSDDYEDFGRRVYVNCKTFIWSLILVYFTWLGFLGTNVPHALP